MRNKSKRTWAFVQPEIETKDYILFPYGQLQVYVVESRNGKHTAIVTADYEKAKQVLQELSIHHLKKV